MIRVYPKNEEDMKLLIDMGDDPHLDFWTEVGLNRPVDIMMTPFTKSSTENKLKMKGMKVEKMIDNVETLIQAEREAKPKSTSGQMTWDDYYTHDQVRAIFQLEIRFSPLLL